MNKWKLEFNYYCGCSQEQLPAIDGDLAPVQYFHKVAVSVSDLSVWEESWELQEHKCCVGSRELPASQYKSCLHEEQGMRQRLCSSGTVDNSVAQRRGCSEGESTPSEAAG